MNVSQLDDMMQRLKAAIDAVEDVNRACYDAGAGRLQELDNACVDLKHAYEVVNLRRDSAKEMERQKKARGGARP